jgi:cation:H+ antiporter
VVCITAVKIDAVDLAIGNIFGSNIFNVFILAVDDLFFVRGPILSLVNPNHIISALFAVIMTAVAVIGLMYRAEKKYFLAWDSISIGLLYLINLMMLFLVKK